MAAIRDPAAPQPQSKVPTDAHDVLPPMPLANDEEPPDPERTSELDAGSIRLADDTREIEADPSLLAGKGKGEDRR